MLFRSLPRENLVVSSSSGEGALSQGSAWACPSSCLHCQRQAAVGVGSLCVPCVQSCPVLAWREQILAIPAFSLNRVRVDKLFQSVSDKGSLRSLWHSLQESVSDLRPTKIDGDVAFQTWVAACAAARETFVTILDALPEDRKSTRLNSSH